MGLVRVLSCDLTMGISLLRPSVSLRLRTAEYRDIGWPVLGKTIRLLFGLLPSTKKVTMKSCRVSGHMPEYVADFSKVYQQLEAEFEDK
jgi:hypothetical protein